MRQKMNNLVIQIARSIKTIEKNKPKMYKFIIFNEFFILAVILSQKIKINIAGINLRIKVRLKNEIGVPNTGSFKNGKSVNVKKEKKLFFIFVGIKDERNPTKRRKNKPLFEILICPIKYAGKKTRELI